MSPQVIAASQNNIAEQISTRLLSGEFNGLPVVDENDSVIGIVTALDILKAIQGGAGGSGEGKKLNSILAGQRYYDTKSFSSKNRYTN